MVKHRWLVMCSLPSSCTWGCRRNKSQAVVVLLPNAVSVPLSVNAEDACA